jgi:hypothetical protein
VPVDPTSPKAVREYLESFKLADAFEREELRQAPVELKLRQIWSLMSSAHLFETDADRETGVTKVRERWLRFRRASR